MDSEHRSSVVPHHLGSSRKLPAFVSQSQTSAFNEYCLEHAPELGAAHRCNRYCPFQHRLGACKGMSRLPDRFYWSGMVESCTRMWPCAVQGPRKMHSVKAKISDDSSVHMYII